MTEPGASEERAAREMTILEFFTELVDDDEAAAARERYCDTIGEALRNVGSWLEVDAWLGAGDIGDADLHEPSRSDPTRRRSFAAAALVIEISGELACGALLLLRDGNEYAASALVRQLIECEYLLRAFRLDFAEAARWHDANDKERWDFSPKKLRKIGGFDDKEYANHCSSGGHPNPAGRPLLELPRAMSGFERTVTGATSQFDFVRVLWLDLAFHVDRAWRALTELLVAEHARFEHTARTKSSIEAVERSRLEWHDADTLATHAGQVIAALQADPATRLGDLLQSEEASAS